MKEKLWAASVICFGILIFLPNPGLAECTDIGGFDNFSLEGANTVVLYSGSNPVARFDVQNCQVSTSSKIRLIRSYVCDGNEVMIDDARCTIMEIRPLGP